MEERIDTHSDSALVLEHVARYRFAAPVVASSDLWIDLGCGTGVAAVEALAAGRPDRIVLVERDSAALQAARQAVSIGDVEPLRLDLASCDDLDTLEQHATTAPMAGCITCFEVIEHLEDFAPLVRMLVRLASDHDFTIVLSAPNDSFWSMHNPHHKTIWGGGAFEEFRALLPEDQLVAHQLALRGTCIQSLGGGDEVSLALSTRVSTSAVPTHYLVAFGPAAARLEPVAGLTQADLDEQRAWERQRDSDLAWLRQREGDLAYYEREAKRLQKELDDLRQADSAS